MTALAFDLKGGLENGVDPASRTVPVLGQMVIGSFRRVAVTVGALEALLARHGFARTFLPAVPTPERALEQALLAMLRARAAGGDGAAPGQEAALGEDTSRQRCFVRTIRTKGKETVYVVVAEAVDLAALGLAHGTDLRVIYDRRQDTIFCTLDAEGDRASCLESQEAQHELRPLWQRYRVADRSNWLFRTLAADGRLMQINHGGAMLMPCRCVLYP